MDPSALIFVALAVAWAAYLIPKALEHHEEGARTRSIDAFSDRMRILARREPLGRRRSALVTVADTVRAEEPPTPAEPTPTYVAVPPTAAQLRARRFAAGVAARRRRRVLDVLFVANVAVAATAILGRVAWHWQVVPAGLVLVWLVTCRVMKIRERRALAAPVMRRVELAPPLAAVGAAVLGARSGLTGLTGLTDELDVDALLDEVDDRTQDVPVIPALDPLDDEVSRPEAWEMLPFVIPTYVGKDRVRRSVRTIDLDSTGVWSSGRNLADSALVRESQESARADGAASAASGPAQDADDRRATGS